VLSSEWKIERVREDASGDSEDGKCVIGEVQENAIGGYKIW